MAGFRRNDSYEDDFGKTIREIYEDIDRRIEDRKEEINLPDQVEIQPIFWEEEANQILQEVGIDYEFNADNVPQDRMDRIYNYYSPSAEEIDDDAVYVDVDPIPKYYAGDKDYKQELNKLGYTLGKVGNVGMYYRLLIDLNFSRGYWLGKFEKAVEEDNDNMILEVSKEMKLYDPSTAEKELTRVVNKCFSSDSQDLDLGVAKK